MSVPAAAGVAAPVSWGEGVTESVDVMLTGVVPGGGVDGSPVGVTVEDARNPDWIEPSVVTGDESDDPAAESGVAGTPLAVISPADAVLPWAWIDDADDWDPLVFSVPCLVAVEPFFSVEAWLWALLPVSAGSVALAVLDLSSAGAADSVPAVESFPLWGAG